MSFQELSIWLKTIVTGIIVLGAIGSLVAALAIALARRLFVPLLQYYTQRWLKAVIRFLIKPMTGDRVRLALSKDEHKGHVYYSFQVLKFLLALFLANCFLIFFLYALIQPYASLLRWTVLVPLILFFLCMEWSVRIFVGVMLPYYFEVDSVIKGQIQRVLKEL